LLGLPTPEMQFEIAERIVKQGWSVRAAEQAVRRVAGSPTDKSRGSALEAPSDPNVRRLVTDLAETLGASVKIEHGPKGGRVVIRYHGLEELEGILAHIK
jgi:ParB family chromosome partitioning protein